MQKKSGFHDFVRKEAAGIQKKQAARKAADATARETAKIKREKESATQYEQLKNAPRLHLDDSQELESLHTNCLQQSHRSESRGLEKRLAARIKAIEQTQNNPACFDYSSQVSHLKSDDEYANIFDKTYGSPLDCQLRNELIQTRNTMIQLSQDFSQNHHVQFL